MSGSRWRHGFCRCCNSATVPTLQDRHYLRCGVTSRIIKALTESIGEDGFWDLFGGADKRICGAPRQRRLKEILLTFFGGNPWFHPLWNFAAPQKAP